MRGAIDPRTVSSASLMRRACLAAGFALCAVGFARSALAVSVALTSPGNSVLAAPATITVAASATPGSGRRILRVDFFKGTTRIGAATTVPYSIVWSNVPRGTYILTATAIDSGGSVAVSNPVAVRVDTAPTVSLTSPANDAVFLPGANITLSAAAADADEAVAKVEFFQGGKPLGTQFLPPYTLTWNNVPSGRYALTARVTDLVGLVTTSAPVMITVNQPPTVNISAPGNGTTFSASATVTVTASATDADGAITRVDFFDGGRLVGTADPIPGTSTYSATLANFTSGAHALTAVATDNLGATATSNAVTISVNVGAGQVYYIHTDHLNTPRMIANQAGTSVWRWDQGEPFGNDLPNGDPSNTGTTFVFDLRFPGQFFDRETGLAQNRYRDYWSEGGRYVQSDPIGIFGGINAYTYVGGNPVSFVDSSGLARNPPICSGPDCVNPPYDLTPNGPGPSPSPSVPKPPRPPRAPDSYESCANNMPTYGMCFSCCIARAARLGQGLAQGGYCREFCSHRDPPYPDAPFQTRFSNDQFCMVQ
jgi:RHS repeat-associated protein